MILSFPTTTASPAVRRFNPRMDGRAVAGLLEHAFTEEMSISGDGHSNRQYLNMLRSYGPIEAASMRGMIGYVWEEEDEVLGHASIQRNPVQSDTWVVGNVATRMNARGRGIARMLTGRCIDEARDQSGCRKVALQMLEGNFAALHVYRALGFKPVGIRTRYQWSQTWVGEAGLPMRLTRPARLSDRAHIWACAQAGAPEIFGQAEAWDAGLYKLGWRWKFWNIMNGDRELWFISPNGALRSSANLQGAMHTLELHALPAASQDEAMALVQRGLHRLDDYVTKPVHATLARGNSVADSALRACGFRPMASFVHMLLSR